MLADEDAAGGLGAVGVRALGGGAALGVGLRFCGRAAEPGGEVGHGFVVCREGEGMLEVLRMGVGFAAEGRLRDS